MIIREANPSDKNWIDEKYNKFFSNNEYPEMFADNFASPFVIIGDNGETLLAGGVQRLAEIVVISDKDKSVRERYDALTQALGCSILIAKELRHQKIYVFVNNDDQYVKHLQKFDFRLMDAKLLVLDLGEQNGST